MVDLQFWNSINPFYSAFLFYSLIFVGNFFLINLFLGVINFTFDKIIEKHEMQEILKSEKLSLKQVAANNKISQDSRKYLTRRRRNPNSRVDPNDSSIRFLNSSPKSSSNDPSPKAANSQLDQSQLGPEAKSSDLDNAEEHQEPIKTLLMNTKSPNPCVKMSARMIANPFFSIVRLLAILVNTFILVMIRYPEKQSEVRILFYTNIVVALFFLVENIVLLIGQGFKNYLKEVFLVFDLLLCLISRPKLNCRHRRNHNGAHRRQVSLSRELIPVHFPHPENLQASDSSHRLEKLQNPAQDSLDLASRYEIFLHAAGNLLGHDVDPRHAALRLQDPLPQGDWRTHRQWRHVRRGHPGTTETTQVRASTSTRSGTRWCATSRS